MIKFDLERALAGDKVVTRRGAEVEQIHSFTLSNKVVVCGVFQSSVWTWSSVGKYHHSKTSDADLFMAPEKLSGFVNVYASTNMPSVIHETKEEADNHANISKRLACIDLSQFEEGHGL